MIQVHNLAFRVFSIKFTTVFFLFIDLLLNYSPSILFNWDMAGLENSICATKIYSLWFRSRFKFLPCKVTINCGLISFYSSFNTLSKMQLTPVLLKKHHGMLKWYKFQIYTRREKTKLSISKICNSLALYNGR